jgi:hypothetical protein
MHNYLRCRIDARLSSLTKASGMEAKKILEVRESDKSGVGK